MCRKSKAQPGQAPAEAQLVNAAADQSRLNRATVWRWVLRGQRPYWGQGSSRLIRLADLERMMARRQLRRSSPALPAGLRPVCLPIAGKAGVA